MAHERFLDRVDAGRRLGAELAARGITDAVVLGLPRGGVPVAAEVARAIGAPLDVLVVRKLGLPRQPEVAMGAIGEGGVRVLNDDIAARVPASELKSVQARERAVLDERVHRLRGGRPPLDLAGRTAIVVDDGVATGATARAACRVARALGAARVVLAVPVGAPDVIADFPEADEVVCLSAPASFMAVGMHYLDFAQTTDAEVARLLAEARS